MITYSFKIKLVDADKPSGWRRFTRTPLLWHTCMALSTPIAAWALTLICAPLSGGTDLPLE